jgi:hypothetical protein
VKKLKVAAEINIVGNTRRVGGRTIRWQKDMSVSLSQIR